MRFRSETERMQHPQARLIPKWLWDEDNLFRENLSDQELTLMEANTQDLMTQVQTVEPQLLGPQQEKRAWLAIALSHPELSPEQLRQISNLLTMSETDLFDAAIAWGSPSFFETLINEYSNAGRLQAMIAAENYKAFRMAAQAGRLDILNRIWDLTPADKRQAMMAPFGYYRNSPFREAALHGHLDVLNRIWELTLDDNVRQDMIAANGYLTFRYATLHGHLDVLNRIWELTPDDNVRQDMIAACNYEAFRYAAQGGRLDILNYIWELTPDDNVRQDMIASDNYDAFREAASRGHLPVVNRLLQFTSVFAYAEMHAREYGAQHVHPFVNNKLTELRADKETVEADNPDAVFDIAETEEAKLCFYMLRNLVRRNDPALLDDIRFLLEIPAVKTLAHRAVTPGAPNELLRLALTIGNQAAAELLDTIPAIHALAVQNNYYRTEARGGIDLASLAQDRESSMRALSTGEQQRLQAAIDRYQPMIKQAGVPNIMTGLRQTLETRYAQKPARLIRDDGSELALPLSWNDFKRLELTAHENTKALEAYYQHKDHSAWRYLSKPNPWMHEQASYVEINPERCTEKWSTFEEYQPLISMLYLAAQDEEITPVDGYTRETRLDHFIDELALIGRAHNWDDTRLKRDSEGTILLNEDGQEITEEFDNLEGDRPSCYSGVKKRLFQSVQGHPLLTMLTKEAVDEEIRDFVRQHFSQINNENIRTELKQVWDKCIEGDEMNDDDWSILKKFDITPDQQQAFIESLAKKYGTQFTGERAFIAQVIKAFSLNEKQDAHVLNFGHVDIGQLLEPRARSATPNNTGFFAPAGQPQENGTNEEESQHKQRETKI